MEFDNVETVKRAVEIDAGMSDRAARNRRRRKSLKQTSFGRRADSKTAIFTVPDRRDLQKEQGAFARRWKQFLTILKEAA